MNSRTSQAMPSRSWHLAVNVRCLVPCVQQSIVCLTPRRCVDKNSCGFVLAIRLLHQQHAATHLCFGYCVPRAGIGPIPYLRASPLERSGPCHTCPIFELQAVDSSQGQPLRKRCCSLQLVASDRVYQLAKMCSCNCVALRGNK